jgi:hypothetical protein
MPFCTRVTVTGFGIGHLLWTLCKNVWRVDIRARLMRPGHDSRDISAQAGTAPPKAPRQPLRTLERNRANPDGPETSDLPDAYMPEI